MKALRDMIGVKSLEEIAMTDAVATVKQVRKIRPTWFCRSTTKRRSMRPHRLGITDNDTQFWHTTAKAVREADLPEMISEEINDSNAQIGDVWRLAVRYVIMRANDEKMQTSFKYKYKFEELWLNAELVCNTSNDNGEAPVTDTIKTYHAACRDHLNILDVQERRLANLTVSKPLAPHRTCKVSPPIWQKRKSRIKLYNFSCKKNPPVRNGVIVSDSQCVVCGRMVESEPKKNTLTVTHYNAITNWGILLTTKIIQLYATFSFLPYGWRYLTGSMRGQGFRNC
jgi:hypothetical protein